MKSIRDALVLLTATALSLCCLAGCSGRIIEPDVDAQGNFHMLPIPVKDPMVNGITAYTLLVPRGWDYQAEVQWRGNMSNLATAAAVVSKPGTSEQVQIYPIIPFAYLQNSVTPIPLGTVYLGCVVAVPIQDPAVFIEQYIVPNFRPGIGNISVKENTGLPKVAQAVYQDYYNSDPNASITASKLVITYTQNGHAYEEAFFCALSFARNPLVPGAVLWRPEFIYSIRDEAGGLDATAGLMQAVASSVTVDLKWFAEYLKVHDLWQQGQMQAIQSAGELSRYLSQVDADITATITSSYKTQQASEDRIYDDFSESIRGVETYTNPVDGGRVQLPSQYSQAWVSANGEYLLSNNFGADPNEGSTVTWTLLNVAP